MLYLRLPLLMIKKFPGMYLRWNPTQQADYSDPADPSDPTVKSHLSILSE